MKIPPRNIQTFRGDQTHKKANLIQLLTFSRMGIKEVTVEQKRQTVAFDIHKPAFASEMTDATIMLTISSTLFFDTI